MVVCEGLLECGREEVTVPLCDPLSDAVAVGLVAALVTVNVIDALVLCNVECVAVRDGVRSAERDDENVMVVEIV